MDLEALKGRVVDAGAEDLVRQQAVIGYIAGVAQEYAEDMVNVFGLHDMPAEQAGAALYERTRHALAGMEHDAVSWNVIPHRYVDGQDGVRRPADEHAAWTRLGWVYCEPLMAEASRATASQYSLELTERGRRMVDELRAIRGEGSAEEQRDSNRQRMSAWLQSVRARRPSEA